MKKCIYKTGFSFIEIIITISILALLTITAITVTDSYKNNKFNSRVLGDLATLRNSLSIYEIETKALPFPGGNVSYFTSDSLYSHSATGAYGADGFITSDIIPKKYMNYLPLDPRLNQFYGYGRTIAKNNFEIAGIFITDGGYESKVFGNYSGEEGPYNLIREYNGPNFVYNKSTDSFPYNPDERTLTAHISAYSGAIQINGVSAVGSGTITGYVFGEGDILKVAAGGYANIYYSDGSMSTLGDSTMESELAFSQMKFVEENNLYTKVKLALRVGTLWTKATTLNEKSSFEVYTTDTAAAVRGTIFGISKNQTMAKSNITVSVGKVQVMRHSVSNFQDLIKKIKVESSPIMEYPLSEQAGVVDIDPMTNASVIQVPENTPAKGVTITGDISTKEAQPQNFVGELLLNNTDTRLENGVTTEKVVALENGIQQQKCIHSMQDNAGECIYNPYASEGWDLVAYADYEKNADMKTSAGGIISVVSTGGLSLKDGAITINSGTIKYDNIFPKLGISDNFRLDIEVNGSGLLDTNGKRLFSTDPQTHRFWLKNTPNFLSYRFVDVGNYSASNIGSGQIQPPSNKYTIDYKYEGKTAIALFPDFSYQTNSTSAIDATGSLFIGGSSNKWFFLPIYDVKIYKKRTTISGALDTADQSSLQNTAKSLNLSPTTTDIIGNTDLAN